MIDEIKQKFNQHAQNFEQADLNTEEGYSEGIQQFAGLNKEYGKAIQLCENTNQKLHEDKNDKIRGTQCQVMKKQMIEITLDKERQLHQNWAEEQ